MNLPALNSATPRLTDSTGEKHPLKCQLCGRSKNELPMNFGPDRWQEHDHHDQPELKVIVLCKTCSNRAIKPHPRLYCLLSSHAPFPGCMALCLDCHWRDGVSCSHPDAKCNGGPGVMLTIQKPYNAMIDGKTYSGPLTLWPSPASACKQFQPSTK